MMMTMTTTMMTMIQTSISGVDSTFDSLFRFFLVLACASGSRARHRAEQQRAGRALPGVGANSSRGSIELEL